MASTSDTIIDLYIPLSQLNSSSVKEIEQEVDHPVVERKENKSDTIIAGSQLISSSANEIKQEVVHPVVERKKENTSDTIINSDILLSRQDSSSATPIQQGIVPPVAGRETISRKSFLNQIKVTVNRLTKSPKTPLSSHCIYRAPEMLRERNEIHFKPRVVSIGPFHHDDPKYADMEAVKQEALDMLIKDSKETKEYFLKAMQKHEPFVRGCYSEPVVMESGKLVQMMLMDAAFIIKFFDTFGESGVDYNHKNEKYSLFKSRQKVADIEHDLRLLENQLPLSFLENVKVLFIDNRRVAPADEVSKVLFATDIWHLPSGKGKIYLVSIMRGLPNEPLHFLDQLRLLHLPHCFRLGYLKLAPNLRFTSIRSARKLQEAGVKVRTENSVFKDYANFTRNGNLKIFPLHIDDTSETSYRNFMAFEQCHFENNRCVSDYIFLMEMLIRDDSEEILKTNEVIVNKLSGGKTATNFLRNLCTNMSYSYHPFRLAPLCEEVEKYCDRPVNKLIKAFNTTPWKVGAILIFLLTFLQTIFAAFAFIQSWKHPTR